MKKKNLDKMECANRVKMFDEDEYFHANLYHVTCGIMHEKADLSFSANNIETMADAFTNQIMCVRYGKRFWGTDDITADREMSDAWDFLNDKLYAMLEQLF